MKLKLHVYKLELANAAIKCLHNKYLCFFFNSFNNLSVQYVYKMFT